MATLRQYRDLVPQAARLFAGDIGSTDAPIRSLLVMIIAGALILIGLVLAAMGFRWTHRLRLPPEGAAAIERDEVIAALRHHQLLAYVDGPAALYWPLRRWLADQVADMTSWRRAIVSHGVRTFVRSCGFALAVSVCCLALSQLASNDLFGPFPVGFVIVLPIVTAIGAALVLLLIAPNSPRIESVDFPVPTHTDAGQEVRAERVIESRPRMLNREPSGLGITLGVTGVAVQCLMLSWWNLSPIGYPLLATSIIRHAGSIAGGILFFVLGHSMVTTGAELLLRFPYNSILVLIDDADQGMVAHCTAARTESRGLAGPRRVVAAVAGTDVRESAERLIRELATAGVRMEAQGRGPAQ